MSDFLNNYKTSGILLIPAFFFIPISVAPAYFFILFALVSLWIQPNLKDHLINSFKHPLTLAFYLFAGIALLSLLWTDDTQQGMWFAQRYIIYLFFPLILLAIDRKLFSLYLSAFLAGIGLTELLSYGLWLDVWEWERHSANNSPEDDHLPFIGHILYSPIAAFATFLMLNRLIEKWHNTSKMHRAILIFFSLSIMLNLFFTHGRIGMVALMALITLLIGIKLYHRKLKALAISALIVCAIPITAYYTLNDFQKRIDIGYNDIVQLIEHNNANSSIGHRLVNWWASIHIVQEHPVLGVGLGDFKTHYIDFMEQQNIIFVPSANPHNQYLFSATTSGALGLISLLTIFFLWLKMTYQNREHLTIKLGLITLMAVISLGESYFWRSNTALLLILFSALLFSPKLITGENQNPKSN